QAESQSPPGKITAAKEKKTMPPESRLAVIKRVVTQMNGSISLTGNYYLPIPQTGQVTIDCTKIPVLEFDDKTTVFLDLENRINSSLKKMIGDYWPNFHVVTVDKKDDFIAVLKKIFAKTKAYGMMKKEQPLTAGNQLSIEIAVDWVIAQTGSRQNRPLLQGLRVVSSSSALLPKAIKTYAQQNSLIITEIDEETGLVDNPEEIYSLPALPVLPKAPAKSFSYALATHLGFSADKDADIKVFDMVKDGFNLSIKADVLIKNTDKKYIIYSRVLPPQFINMLKEAGYELIFIAESASPNSWMERILSSLNVPYVSGYFTFSGVEGNQAPYKISFSGTKIKTGRNEYVIDFAIDQGLRGLLQEAWSASFVRY
nr:hypothetical protein [Smithellaceae bacterium]